MSTLAKGTNVYAPRHRQAMAFAFVAIALGLTLGAAIGYGIRPELLIGLLLAPCIVLVVLARPHIAVMVYAVFVYTDLLGVLVQFDGAPPLARFVGIMLLAAVLGYRLVLRQDGLVADRMTWWLVAYGLLLAAGLIYARAPDLVMTELLEYARNFLAYLVIINTLTTVRRVRTTLWLLLGTGVLLALLSLYQTFTGHFEQQFFGLAQAKITGITEEISAYRPGGVTGDANYFGQSLLIVLPLGLYLASRGGNLRVRLAGLAASLVLVAAVVFTYSRGDLVALAALLIAAAVYKRPRPQYILGALVVAALLLSVLPPDFYARIDSALGVFQSGTSGVIAESSLRGRLGAAMAAVQMFADHPFLGVGRSNYPLYELNYIQGTSLDFQSTGIPPHDLFLEVASELGVVGIIIFGGILILTARSLLEARRRFLAEGNSSQAELAVWMGIGLFAYLVTSLFLHGAYQFWLWLQISMIVALRHARGPTSDDGDRGQGLGAMNP